MQKSLKELTISQWNKMSDVKKATVAFLFCTVLQKCVALISTPIFTRLMSTEQYGLFTVYQSWLSLISIITTFRLDYDVFNKGMTKYEDGNSYVTTMQTLTSVLTFIALIVYLAFKNAINEFIGLPTVVILAIFAELFFMPAISFWTLKERYEFKYKALVSITVLMAVFNILVGVVAVYFSDSKGIARILSCVLVQVVFGLFFYGFNIYKSKKIFVLEQAKFALIFNIPLIPHYFSSYILSIADKIMIQKMVGLSEAGIYGVVYSAGLVMTMISTAINNALIPWQYKSLKEDKQSSIKIRVNEMLMILALIVTVFILFAPELVMILASKEYFEAIYVVPPVASSVLFIFLYNLVCNAEFYYDKNKFTMIMSGVCALLNIILNFIFIKLFGYMAAGYTTLACYIITAIVHIIYANNVARKNNKEKIYDLTRVIMLAVLMVGVSVVASVLYKHIIIRYIFIAALVAVLIYFRKKIIRLVKDR